MVRAVSLCLLGMAALLSPLATEAFLPVPASKLAAPGTPPMKWTMMHLKQVGAAGVS